jgi:hypothetical protein
METKQIILIISVIVLIITFIINIVLLVKMKKSEGFSNYPQILSSTSSTFNINTNAGGIRFILSSSNSNNNDIEGLQILTYNGITYCYLVNKLNQTSLGISSKTNMMIFPTQNRTISLTLTYSNNILTLRYGNTILYSYNTYSLSSTNIGNNLYVSSIVPTNSDGSRMVPGQTGYIPYTLTVT